MSEVFRPIVLVYGSYVLRGVSTFKWDDNFRVERGENFWQEMNLPLSRTKIDNKFL